MWWSLKKPTSQRGTEGHWFVERWSHPLLIYSVLRPKSARPSELTFESFPACALVFCGLPTCRTIVLRIYDAYCAKAAVLGFGHGQFMRFCRMVMCPCCCVAAGIERDLCILNKDLGKYDFQHKQHRSRFSPPAKWGSLDLVRAELHSSSATSIASSKSQWALPDINREFKSSVGHFRTSTASARCQWAVPDLNGTNVRIYLEMPRWGSLEVK